MKIWITCIVACALLLLAGDGLGQSKAAPGSRLQWEYGVLSKLEIGGNPPTYHWNDHTGTIEAKTLDDVIAKLKQPAVKQPPARQLDAMNALGALGWEFIDVQRDSPGGFVAVDMRFKRLHRAD